MASNDALAFWTVFLVIFFINILSPMVAAGLSDFDVDTGTPVINDDTGIVELQSPSITDFFMISALSVALVPFWTLGLPVYVNLVVMLPLRVLGWILVLRLLRGN